MKPTVGAVLDWYDKEHLDADEGPVAAERQRYAIASLRAFFGSKTIDSVDIEASRAYRVARLRGIVGRKVVASTVRRELGVLVAAADHCRRWRHITAEQMPSVELPTIDEAKPAWLTKDQIRTLVGAANGDLKDFILLAYYWGSRRQAVECLRACQVDLKHGSVDLHPPGTKRTKKRKPIVPIYSEVRSIVEVRLITAERCGIEGGYLFPAHSHLAGRPYAEFYTAFKKLCDDLKIVAVDGDGDTPWPHLLRHSRATHMLMDGEDIYKVAKLLGDTVATVERTYGHHSVEYLATHSNVA